MTNTVLLPDWTTIDEMKQRGELKPDLFKGYDTSFSASQGCDVIVLDERVETMPFGLRDVPMRAIALSKPNSPFIDVLVDGFYEDGNITARVETYHTLDEVRLQSIRAVGSNGTTLEELNLWFDELLAGKLTSKNRNPITYSAASSKSTVGYVDQIPKHP